MKLLHQAVLFIGLLNFTTVDTFNCSDPPVKFKSLLGIHDCCPMPPLVGESILSQCKQPTPIRGKHGFHDDEDENFSTRKKRRFKRYFRNYPIPLPEYMSCLWTCILEKSGVVVQNEFSSPALKELLHKQATFDVALINIIDLAFQRCWSLRDPLIELFGDEAINPKVKCPSIVIDYIMDCMAKTIFVYCTRLTWRGIESPDCEEKRAYVRECHLTLYRYIEYRQDSGISFHDLLNNIDGSDQNRTAGS